MRHFLAALPDVLSCEDHLLELLNFKDGLDIAEDEVFAGPTDAFDVDLDHVSLDAIQTHLRDIKEEI